MSSLHSWIDASRPKTLVAGIVPVMVGSCMAFSHLKTSNWLLITLCLVFSVLIQIGTNFANDYYDFIKGADKRRENAPQRASTSGKVEPIRMRNASFMTLTLAFFVGLLLLYFSKASPILVLVGIGSVICALGYTGGPYPLAYNGLGDVFVILAFGFVAVEITNYVLLSAGGIKWEPAVAPGLGVGCIINNILVVNNYRDYDEDKKVFKNTSVVLFGKAFGKLLFFSCLLVSTFVCPILDSRLLFCVVVFPIGIFAYLNMIRAKNSKSFSFALGLSSLCVLLYGFAASSGILLK